jgi:hypothetical protein
MRHKIRHQARTNKIGSETDLILALENARTRFVVAVALEQKSTPRRLWGVYLETEERLRHCLKALRMLDQARRAGNRQCALALEALVRRSDSTEPHSGPGEALHLCFLLQEVLMHLERMAPG